MTVSREYYTRILVVICNILLIASFSLVKNEYTDDNQFATNVARCEYSAFRLGSELADVFNAPIGYEDWDERVHQDFITEHLGFAPWMAGGVTNNNGNTFTNKKARDIAEKGGWFGKDIANSPYSILSHKWIYMFGDSTTRQVWASFAAPFQGNNFERNAKEWSRHYCNKQAPHRAHHPKGGLFESEGWGGPCGVNEVTCHVAGFGEGGLLSFDWKHFPYEDYDEWMFGDDGPWIKGFHGEGNRRPDLLTLQFGLHSCWHASHQGLYSGHLNGVTNTSMIEGHLASIPKLMAAVRRAIEHPGPQDPKSNPKNPTIVVVVTSGSSGMMENGTSIDDCILRYNRAAEKAAHEQGFAVLERGEIERRLMYKSVFSDSPILTPDMHLPQPAQNLIATTLTHLYTCLNQSIVGNEYKFEKLPERRRAAPPARPLHSPPAG